MALRALIPFDWIWGQETTVNIYQPKEAGPYDDIVVAVLERLPRRYRELLEMRYWERLTLDEIAERIGKNSRGSAMYHVRKAERRFRRDFLRTVEDYEGAGSTRSNL